MQKWDVTVNSLDYEIVFEDCKVSGIAKIRIDGNLGEYRPILVKNIGMFYMFDIVDSEFILKLDLEKNTPLALIQDGVYLETGLQLESDVVTRLREAQSAPDPLGAKDKAYMGSFLCFVVLTYLNLLLISLNSGFNFPFSVTIPQVFWSIGWHSQGYVLQVPSGILLAFGFILASVYLVLYLLSKNRSWPILTALVLISADTLFLLYLSIGNFSANIINILFHAWVLWSIAKLYITRRRIQKEASRA